MDNKKEQREGVDWGGKFLYFNLETQSSLILLRQLKRKLEKIVDAISLVIVILGYLSIILWFYLNLENLMSDFSSTIVFWQHQHPLLLFFLVSLWFNLFLIYRASQKKAANNIIKAKDFKDSQKYSKLNVALAYNSNTLKIFEDAYLLALKLKQNEVAPIHLFKILLQTNEVQKIFIRLGTDAKKLVEKIDRNLQINNKEGYQGQTKWSLAFQNITLLGFQDAVIRGQKMVDATNLIPFLYPSDKLLADILYDLDLNEDKLRNVIEWHFTNVKIIERKKKWSSLAAFKPSGGMNKAYTAIATPTLDHFSHDLTLAAKYGRLDFCLGRNKEIQAIFEAFSSGQCGVLLVGETGVGKKTIIGGIAQLMVSEEVPSFLKDKRLLEIDVSRLVSGANPSVAQERLLNCISEANRAGNVLLYIANIENIVGISAGQEQSLDIADVLAEAIMRRHIYCISTVSSSNYARYIDGQAIGETMTTVGVKEPTENKAIQVLESKVSELERYYQILFSYGAIEQAVKLSVKYLHDKFLPAKALELLKAAASIAVKKSSGKEKLTCEAEEVALAISDILGIPIAKITEDEGEKLLNLEMEIHKRMIGQEEAVKAVSASLRRARTAVSDNQRPIASFLFLGPTGVGKTELAKTVSSIYFGGEQYMVRIDMSEYQRPESVRKLIGDVDGTLGYLTEAVRKKPFSLILFDEIEKAHPDILNLFLQLLDDGRLTDGQGRTISFSESIIIATSNIGANYIQEQIKKETSIEEIRKELVDNMLSQHMRPELINRYDGIIVFTPLSEEHIVKIATIMLKEIKMHLKEKGILMKADKEGVLVLAKEAYDPKFGARPLRRLLQEKVEDIVANMILASKIKRRDTVIINNLGEIEVEKADEL
jgi:ATP-dependent Clp protease ATP-binding subunit ClpC